VPLEVVAFVPKRSNTLGLLCESLFLFTVVSTVIFLFVCFDMFSGILAMKKNIYLTFAGIHLEIYTTQYTRFYIQPSKVAKDV
jgi:hypothetical protein